jgi:hypothetical protein
MNQEEELDNKSNTQISAEERIARNRERRERIATEKQNQQNIGCGCLFLSAVGLLALWGAVSIGIALKNESDRDAARRAWEQTPEGQAEVRRRRNIQEREERQRELDKWNDPREVERMGKVLESVVDPRYRQ